jgi:hypothetical protein
VKTAPSSLHLGHFGLDGFLGDGKAAWSAYTANRFLQAAEVRQTVVKIAVKREVKRGKRWITETNLEVVFS